MPELSPFETGIAAAALAGFLATALGAAPLFLLRTLTERTNALLLSFAAGVMLAATVFSLLVPALDGAREALGSDLHGALSIVAALSLGGATLSFAHRLLPHEHFLKGREGVAAARLSRVWLFVLAIAIHNFPEGLSLGVGGASGDSRTALGVTFGLGLQNLPEGLSVAVALYGLGYSRRFSFLTATATGLVELAAGFLGAGAVTLGPAILPWALGFAAGAMLFVVSDEIIPETHRPGLAEGSTAALFVGFCVMMVLDVA